MEGLGKPTTPHVFTTMRRQDTGTRWLCGLCPPPKTPITPTSLTHLLVLCATEVSKYVEGRVLCRQLEREADVHVLIHTAVVVGHCHRCKRVTLQGRQGAGGREGGGRRKAEGQEVGGSRVKAGVVPTASMTAAATPWSVKAGSRLRSNAKKGCATCAPTTCSSGATLTRYWLLTPGCARSCTAEAKMMANFSSLPRPAAALSASLLLLLLLLLLLHFLQAPPPLPLLPLRRWSLRERKITPDVCVTSAAWVLLW